MMNDAVILGVDPGLARLGYGVIAVSGGKMQLLAYGVVGTPAGHALPQRLRTIYLAVDTLLATYNPDDIAFEELFFAKNAKTALMIGAARGVALTAAANRTEKLYEYTPMQVKQAVTGYGGAEKGQIQRMVQLLLNMNEIPKPDDAADALAVAITHANCRHVADQFLIK